MFGLKLNLLIEANAYPNMDPYDISSTGNKIKLTCKKECIIKKVP